MSCLAAALYVLASPGLFGGFCPFPVPACHEPVGDINCDGKDDRHCRLYDIDGAAFGDCTPDGLIDDFWRLFDGNFDGVADPCDPSDTVLMQPDGISDGQAGHPMCDLFNDDTLQIQGLSWLDDTSLGTGLPGQFDLVRGSIGQPSSDGGSIDLGAVTCLADDLTSGGAFTVVEEPPPGEAYFYLIRWKNTIISPFREYPYGWSGCLERVVQPGNGDCSP